MLPTILDSAARTRRASPTHAEIVERTEAIRHEWTPKQRASRQRGTAAWKMLLLRLPGLSDRTGESED